MQQLRTAVSRFIRRPRFRTKDVVIGRNVTFGRNVVFTSRRVRIGDNVSFGNGVRVDATSFDIGDYGTIYDDCFFPGPGTLTIGHNFWLGRSSIVDCAGTTSIGHNVGVGAHSQLWSHIRFGDVLYGCRFNGQRPLVIEDDVWLVGHCLVSPARLGARSMAMLGSVVTGDIAPDRCYAGVPAQDMTDRFGSQFDVRSVDERAERLRDMLETLAQRPGLADIVDRVRIVSASTDLTRQPDDVLVLNVADRTYRKRGTELERSILRALLPDAKFVPAGTTLAVPPATADYRLAA